MDRLVAATRKSGESLMLSSVPLFSFLSSEALEQCQLEEIHQAPQSLAHPFVSQVVSTLQSLQPTFCSLLPGRLPNEQS